MSSPEIPPPNPAKSRVIIGEKANFSAKPKAKAKAATVHADYGEIDMSSPLLAKASKRKGPSRSRFKWLGATIFIKLFRLSVKFIPVAGALAAAVYGYTYFFGSIPLVDSVKKQLGLQVAPPAQTESRVTQIAIAASDSRVHLGNAIGTGDTKTVDAIEAGQYVPPTTTAATAPISAPTVSAPVNRPSTPAGPSVTDKLGDMLTSLKEEVTSLVPEKPPVPVDPGETISRQITLDSGGDDASAGDADAAPPPRQITIVQDSRMAVRSPFHNVNYRRGPSPSADFSQWAQSITIDRVEPDFKPKVSINRMTFVSGNMVDFALGVTLAGISDNGTVVVFRDNRGAHVTVPY